MPIDPYMLAAQQAAANNRMAGVDAQVASPNGIGMAAPPAAAAPGMSQSQFSGYPGAPGPGSKMTPQQIMMLLQLLKAREQQAPAMQPIGAPMP